jgi:acyl-CoA hydrolase
MENYKLVMPENLNQYGFLFGGYLLKWVDEYGFIAAILDYPGCNFVTVGLDKVEFNKSVKEGSILKFIVEKVKVGKTSVQYGINVFLDNSENDKSEHVFSTNITFVNVDASGKKKSLP